MLRFHLKFEIDICILIIFVCIYSCLLLLDDRIRLNKVMLVKIFALCALNRLRSKINCIVSIGQHKVEDRSSLPVYHKRILDLTLDQC